MRGCGISNHRIGSITDGCCTRSIAPNQKRNAAMQHRRGQGNDLGRDQPLQPFSDSVTEANAIVYALMNASTEMNAARR
jgi:hypothetical protein